MSAPYETYLHMLVDLHRLMAPARYLEIGVDEGHSLACAGRDTRLVGVDPSPRVESLDHPDWAVVEATSEAFFRECDVAEMLGGPLDLAFVDGLHHFEVALADVLSIESYAHAGTVVLVHDALPIDGPTSERDRSSVVWSGDVWKAVVLLRSHRPDLTVTTLDVSPTGMAIITGFGDPVDGAWVGPAVDDLMDAGYGDLLAMGVEDSLGVRPGTREVLIGLIPTLDP